MLKRWILPPLRKFSASSSGKPRSRKTLREERRICIAIQVSLPRLRGGELRAKPVPEFPEAPELPSSSCEETGIGRREFSLKGREGLPVESGQVVVPLVGKRP